MPTLFKLSNWSYLFLAALTLSSCKKDEPQDVPITINNVWANEQTPLVLGQSYTNPITNESVNFYTCNYYLSNFQLRQIDGTWWKHPDSYVLVRVTDNNQHKFDLTGVPPGEYDAVRFLVGVDSVKNVSGAQAGDLAPSNSMFWSWSTGYIMIKLEGSSPDATQGFFSFHVGGFRDSDSTNVTRWVELPFDDKRMKINRKSTPQLDINVDVAATFTNSNTLEKFTSLHASSTLGHVMATQFSSGISIKNVK